MTSNPSNGQYTPRPKIEPLENICKCGHGQWHHSVLWHFLPIDGQCRDCMCPKYKLGCKMTMNEYVRQTSKGEYIDI